MYNITQEQDNTRTMPHPLDKSNLRQVILDFPKQFEKALKFSSGIKTEGKFNKVIICGMGGSALPADVVKIYLESKNIDLPIIICRTYNLPSLTRKGSLILASSYSGNTEETLACYEEAKKRGLKIIGLARGGKLEEQCLKDKTPFIKYPNDGPTFQPRYALGYVFSSILSILANQELIPNVHQKIRGLASKLAPKKLEKQGKDIAAKLVGTIPIFYSSDKFGESVARIVKIKINENSKTQAFYNVFPELNHNEMVGFTNLQGKYHVVIFHDKDDHERIQKRIKITSEILKNKGVPVSILEMQGETILEKMFSTILLGDWISYYLALKLNQDPTPVKMVEDFKKKMEKIIIM
jgi:glucose/mannose-6-phosphate isomerase